MSATNQIPAFVTDGGQGMLDAGTVSPASNSAHHSPEQSYSQKPYDSGNGELPATTTDTDVLIVDWDGPDDPQNPKKCVTSLEQHGCWAYSSCAAGAIDANGPRHLLYHRLLSSVQFRPL
jgi:hypothetical protein